MIGTAKASIVGAALTALITGMLVMVRFDRPFRSAQPWCASETEDRQFTYDAPLRRDDNLRAWMFRTFLRDTDAPSLSCGLDGPDTYRLLWASGRHVKIVTIEATPDANWVVSSAHYLTTPYSYPQVLEKRPPRWLSDDEVGGTLRSLRRTRGLDLFRILYSEPWAYGVRDTEWMIDSRVNHRFRIFASGFVPTMRDARANEYMPFFLRVSGLRPDEQSGDLAGKEMREP